jgi:hypothetical protein
MLSGYFWMHRRRLKPALYRRVKCICTIYRDSS